MIALRRRRRRDNRHEDQQTKKKLARLISDLAWSIDQPSSDSPSESDDEPSSEQYEVRQVQQQFTIEIPLSQPVQRHKSAYGKRLRVRLRSDRSSSPCIGRGALRSIIVGLAGCSRTVERHCCDFHRLHHRHLHLVVRRLSNVLCRLRSAHVRVGFLCWLRQQRRIDLRRRPQHIASVPLRHGTPIGTAIRRELLC